MLDDVRVVEAAEDLDLSLDLLKDALHFDLALVEDFDGNSVPGDLIDGH